MNPKNASPLVRVATALALLSIPVLTSVSALPDPTQYLPLPFDSYCQAAAVQGDRESDSCSFGYCDPMANVQLHVRGSADAPWFKGHLYCGDVEIASCSSDANDPDGCTADGRYSLIREAANLNVPGLFTATAYCRIEILGGGAPRIDQLLMPGGPQAPPNSAYAECVAHNYLI